MEPYDCAARRYERQSKETPPKHLDRKPAAWLAQSGERKPSVAVWRATSKLALHLVNLHPCKNKHHADIVSQRTHGVGQEL